MGTRHDFQREMNMGVRKLKSKKGETLIETLVAILVIVFSGLTLYYAVTTSARINAAAATADNAFREQTVAAEQQQTVSYAGKAQIVSSSDGFSADVDVKYSGGDGKLSSYQLSGG